MRRGLLVVLTLGLLIPSAGPAHAVSATSIASGLAFPAAISFASGGMLFYAERFTGEIRSRNVGTGADNSVFTIPSIATAGEQGLLGLAVPPTYPSTPYIWAYATRIVGLATENQIIRIAMSNGAGTGMEVMVRMVSGTNHNGGAMVFGAGGKLHVVTGEVGIPSYSQDTKRLVGKVLRLGQDGASIPENPFGNRVFSIGHRNMFGIAQDPRTGKFWVTENGPGCNDEINLVVRAGNFAWGPNQTCGSPAVAANTNQDGPQPRLFPKRLYNPTIAPTGAVFCNGCGLGSAVEGQLLFGAWNTGEIRRLALTPDRLGISSSTVMLDLSQGILGMTRHPQTGRIYFSDPDQIFRLDP